MPQQAAPEMCATRGKCGHRYDAKAINASCMKQNSSLSPPHACLAPLNIRWVFSLFLLTAARCSALIIKLPDRNIAMGCETDHWNM